MPRKHTLPPPEFELPRTLHDDRHRMEEVQVPVVTISATFRSDIAEHLGEQSRVVDEAVFSRAHYSMSVAVFSEATNRGLTSWLVDPTNYVSREDWKKIVFVERLGQIAARTPVIKRIKDFFDTFARGRLPISSAIEKSLLYLTGKTTLPIISLHYETGNILTRAGKKVVQVVTDPHVRPQYLIEANRETVSFAVFDEYTREIFLQKAKDMGIAVSLDRVVATGPPVDPRIVKARKGKKSDSYKKRHLRLVVTTGGLGTNKGEIKTILEQLFSKIAELRIELILYAGTQADFKEMFYSIARDKNVSIGDIESSLPVRVVYDESIIRANQELIEHAFSWADGFVTKPSGDMAYDAVAAGCFLLTLEPWGEWEDNIHKVFSALGIAQKANTEDFVRQIADIKNSWIEGAIEKALRIDKLFLGGAKKIVDLQQKLS